MASPSSPASASMTWGSSSRAQCPPRRSRSWYRARSSSSSDDGVDGTIAATTEHAPQRRLDRLCYAAAPVSPPTEQADMENLVAAAAFFLAIHFGVSGTALR